jgi:hypothetical protein
MLVIDCNGVIISNLVKNVNDKLSPKIGKNPENIKPLRLMHHKDHYIITCSTPIYYINLQSITHQWQLIGDKFTL